MKRRTINLLSAAPGRRVISTDTTPPIQQPVPSSSTSSVKKIKPRLRDRAGLPAFEGYTKSHEMEASGDSSLSSQGSFKPMTPWNMRTRNQLDRTHMSHRESAIALEILQDLAIPLEELTTTTTSQDQSPSEIRDLLLHHPEFHSILSQKSSLTSTQSLSRQRPNQLSAEDVRVEDILKELTDSLLLKIDSFQSDFELLRWIDQQVFAQTRPPSASQPSSPPDQNINPTHQLGQVFEAMEPLAHEYELEIDFEQDPEKILQQPLCFTPLFTPILLHLIKTFSARFKNPQLALYLFDWARSHPDPLVKYFGLTRDVYLVALDIKWDVFHDFRGIHKDLAEMKALGLELDDRFKRLIQLITQVVLEDEVQAERYLLNSTDIPLERRSCPEEHLDQLRKVSPAERYHVSQIESLLNEFIESQNDALALKFRSPPPHHRS
ncbi:hypothetical protein PCANC_22430 [Puccinia coronata f. sp. avenae]|uniref:Mtf2-like C-terminal domain-containing protein n=1 Tax=Puccinia coronata f. sp. avenae TaxID=200324 RepID=A0A2N5VKC5_9BASI|nr:hypothetical protein PCANC_22430 [Puccinia coronata f. sp. avenae]PLW50455.1 hypothetical protein PCASD_01401 [Puccinia coronata f. sp. avenae]